MHMLFIIPFNGFQSLINLLILQLSYDGVFISDMVPKIVDLLKNATTILDTESREKVKNVTDIAILRVEDVVREFVDFGVARVKEVK